MRSSFPLTHECSTASKNIAALYLIYSVQQNMEHSSDQDSTSHCPFIWVWNVILFLGNFYDRLPMPRSHGKNGQLWVNKLLRYPVGSPNSDPAFSIALRIALSEPSQELPGKDADTRLDREALFNTLRKDVHRGQKDSPKEIGRPTTCWCKQPW